MMFRRPTHHLRRVEPRSKPVAGPSWLSLVASTSLGVSGNTVHAHVSAEASDVDDSRTYRLIVQSYDSSVLRGDRPVGSTQRFVTGAELRYGVTVTLVELREVSAERSDTAKAVVVAWVEDGSVELELDARAARPDPDSLAGTAPKSPDSADVVISLTRRLELAA